ncbi:MAG TPA: hypothetical protein PLK30_14325 [Blastocatellia bacterium]|nr:hypothetical protein [Blastocatellia bacterium]
MKCKEIIRLMTYGRYAESAKYFDIIQHAFTCKNCREELTINSVINSLVKNHNFSDEEQSVWDEARLINQVKARIQSARENGVGTWESAVISFRGWLVGFAAAAILLLALSTQLAANNRIDKKEEGRLDLISNTQQPSQMSEDLISSNTQVNRPSELNSEEVENVR